MKKLFCILSLLLCLALPALAEDVLPDFSALTGDALLSREQLIQDHYVSIGYTGHADAMTQAVNAYLVQLSDFGLKQQLSLPLKQTDCEIALYAFAFPDKAIPTMTYADAALGWVISETHLLLELNIYTDGVATVEIICRPELLTGQTATATESANTAAASPCNGLGNYTQICPACNGDGRFYRDCTDCGGDGRHRCSSCGGDGRRACSTCSGSGHHSSHHGGHHSSKSCSSCGGRGQRSCSSCSGHGYRHCGTCSGFGTTYTNCGTCSGYGQYPVPCATCGGHHN